MSTTKRYRVGIVGLQPGRSWAAFAHLPGIRAQQDKFEVTGVANRTYESSRAAAETNGIPRAYQSVDELVRSDDVDVVAVTVRVPNHREVVLKALDAGKVIYCEWPLARDLTEAEELAKVAGERGVRTFIGTQAIASPHIRHLKKLISGELIGSVLSHTLIGYGRIWGPEIDDDASEKYLLDDENGATMLTIPVAHTLAAVQHVFGNVADVRSVIATRRKKVFSKQSKSYFDMTAPDQVGVQGYMSDGSVISLHYRGGFPPDKNGFTWEVNGSKGVLRVTGLTGSIQIEELRIERCLAGEGGFSEAEVPEELLTLCRGDYVPGNVGRMYEVMWKDLVHGTREAPDFNYAVELHRLIDRIRKAAIRLPLSRIEQE
jgi:predicted dehydrogenase